MSHLRPYLLLFFLALVVFHPLALNPSFTLYSDSSDFLAQHAPAKMFLARSLRETGELPLWNPEQYAGSPFVHDIQVGLFYPPNLPLYFIGESAIGPVLSWLVFAHVVLAGWLMYGYARHSGLGEGGAFTAAVGFMLSPRWMMQLFLAGHTVTEGICWLPLVLMCVEKAIAGRWRWALGGGLVYALFVLGTHPQWTFYGSLLIGLWPLRLVERSTITRWLLAEGTVVLFGLGLCAIQLLPTIEAAGETNRARGMGVSWSLDGAKAAFFTLIGPFPDARAEAVHWETRGGIGFTWAILALIGVRIGGKAARVPTILAGAMLLYALGASFLIDRLPGFNSFRMPTRILLTLAFPVAWLAGLGVRELRSRLPKERLRSTTTLVLALVGLTGLLSLVAGRFPKFADLGPGWWIYWLAVPIAWYAFVIRRPADSGRAAVAIAIVDVLLFVAPYPKVIAQSEVYRSSPALEYLREHTPNGERVYDPEGDQPAGLLGPGSPLASAHGIASVRGYNPLDVARYRQFLAFIHDVGEPQMAFTGEFTHPVSGSFKIVNRDLLDLLGVRYIVSAEPIAGFRQIETFANSTTYDFLGGGAQRLGPLHLYENDRALPRCFLVTLGNIA